MSGTKRGHSTFWRESDAETPVFEEVGDVYDVGELSATRELKDAKPYGNTDDKKKSEASGLIDEGTQEFVVRFKKGNAQAQGMIDDFYNPTQVERRYQLRINDTDKSLVTMTSIVSSLGQTFPNDDYIDLKFTLTHNDVDRTGAWT